MRPFIYYIFANEDCRLTWFSLESNALFSNPGKRTLLKAYSLSPCKSTIHFRFGPLPFTESTLKHAFVGHANNQGAGMAISQNISQITPGQLESPSPVRSGGRKAQAPSSSPEAERAQASKISASQLGVPNLPQERYELVVTRRPNYTGLGLRNLPINKVEREKLS